MSTRFVFLFCALSASVFAQGERGTLNGTIADSSGAVVAGASVKILNPATGVELNATTTDAGVYRMPSLMPGTYRISVSAPGFRTTVRENVVLSVAQTLTVDFSLEVGAVTDSITVSSDPPLLETGTAEIGSYVSKKEFDSWPIAVGGGRRQIQQFIFTSLPGTIGSTWAGSINGGQNFSHEILIDGISLGRMDLAGGANSEFSPSSESVSEFKLQTGTVSAQYPARRPRSPISPPSLGPTSFTVRPTITGRMTRCAQTALTAMRLARRGSHSNNTITATPSAVPCTSRRSTTAVTRAFSSTTWSAPR